MPSSMTSTSGFVHFISAVLRVAGGATTLRILIPHAGRLRLCTRSGWSSQGPGSAICCVLRQVHAEGGAAPRLAVDPDVPEALLHDAIHSGEAQPGSLA